MHSHSRAVRTSGFAEPDLRTRLVRVSTGVLAGLLLVLPGAFAAETHAGNIVYGTIVPSQRPLASRPVAAVRPLPAEVHKTPDGVPLEPKPVRPVCLGALDLPSNINVPLGKSVTVALPEPVRSRTVGNAAVVQTMLISPKVLYVLGSKVGTTNMFVQGRSGSCSVVDIVVSADSSSLQQAIRNLMPEETGVRVKSASGALVLTGKVSNAVQAQRIEQLAEQFLASANQAVPGADGRSSGANQPGKVINMLQVAAPQQVMLEVKVAEVSKNLIKKLGVNTNLFGGIGSASYGLTGTFGIADATGLLTASEHSGNSISADNRDVLVKILAEPNLMAISGQKADFLAGGKLFLPMPQSNGTISLQEEPYGVGLTFTPTVLDHGRINLQVAPEVSELSQNGSSMSFGSGANAQRWNLPIITTRRASTTIQVFDGQSFAIGGLMKNNVSGELKSLPLLGDLPLIGSLFRSTAYQDDKTELVFIVTPRLVKALPEQYPLPTDSFGNVSSGHLYMNGDMEGYVAPSAPVVNPAAARVAPASKSLAPAPQMLAPTPTQPLAQSPAKPTQTSRPAPALPPAVHPVLLAPAKPMVRPVVVAPTKLEKQA